MAPEVKVPTNFGRKHIGSLTHSNLVLNLKDGKKSRANSLILSFNSPVIENLVATLDVTSLDMQDFGETAVDCFVDCVYTGEIEMLEKPVFREINKMATVFEVFWLAAQCGEYFRGLVETVDKEKYEDLLFLFNEAKYVFTALKERGLLDLAMKKIGSVKKSKALFVKNYMEDFNNISTNDLDLVMELAGCDTQIVVHSLTEQFTKHLSVHGTMLTVNSRHLLSNVNLSLCRTNDRPAYENLFDMLQGAEGITFEDLKWVLSLYRMSSSKDVPCKYDCKGVSLTKPSATISNLFHSFDRFKKLAVDDFVDRLGNDAEVKSMLMFVEAVWFWLWENKSSVSLSSELLNNIVGIKQKRGWDALPIECFNLCAYNGMHMGKVLGPFFGKLWEHDVLFISESNRNRYAVVDCNDPLQITFKQLVTAENKLVFHFKLQDNNLGCCVRNGECGFIIKTTPPTFENPDLFDIKLCTEQSEYPPEIHLHEDLVRAENMHFMLEYYREDKWWHLPLSWAGKPFHDCNNWKWGWVPLGSNKCRVKVLLFNK